MISQRIIKYLAMAFAIFLVICILSSIVYAFAFVGSIFTDEKNDSMKKYSINEVINDLEIEVGGCNLVIKRGLLFTIETNNKYIKYEIDDRELHIEEENHFINDTNNKLIVTIPYHLGSLSIETGAGKVEIADLEVNDLDLDLGAGKTNVNDTLVLNNCDIDGGAGELSIKDSDITNMDLDMGVGKVTLNSKLAGSSQINAGIGEVNLELIGSKNDYSINVSKGIGNVRIDTENISNDTVFGNGENKIRISGGIGNINVSFK